MTDLKHEFDNAKLEELGISASGIYASSISEEFRAIKRTIMQEGFPENGDNLNRVMVTSVGEQEGKTFCAMNLARSISFERNKQVLLVDANVLSPKLHTFVNPPPKIGLIDYLNDDILGVNEVINNTDIERLRIMTMGNNHHFANELLNSETMTTLMDEFKTRYADRVVIFDAPPMLGVNEAITLARHVDQIVLVVPDGEIKVSELQRVRESLPKHVKVHFVLNKTLNSRDWKRNEACGTDDISENDKVLTGSHAFT